MLTPILFLSILAFTLKESHAGVNPYVLSYKIPAERALEYDEINPDDDVALEPRINLADIPLPALKNLQGKSNNEEFVGPVSQSNMWGPLVEPIMSSVLDIGSFCQCKGFGDCGCCTGFGVKPIGIRNNLCLNGTIKKDVRSGSNYMFHAKVLYDQARLIDVSASEKEPPTVCLNTPLSLIQICIQLADFHLDRQENMGCGCISISAHWRENMGAMFTLPRQCVCLGKPLSAERKRGIFGGVFNLISQSPLLQTMKALPYIG